MLIRLRTSIDALSPFLVKLRAGDSISFHSWALERCTHKYDADSRHWHEMATCLAMAALPALCRGVVVHRGWDKVLLWNSGAVVLPSLMGFLPRGACGELVLHYVPRHLLPSLIQSVTLPSCPAETCGDRCRYCAHRRLYWQPVNGSTFLGAHPSDLASTMGP